MKRWLKTSVCIVTSMFGLMIYPLFERDKAAYAGQQGEWDYASGMLTPYVIDHSDDPFVLYDAGVASYKVQEYDHARAYFDAASVSDKANPLLKEQAYFNAGNAAVKQK